MFTILAAYILLAICQVTLATPVKCTLTIPAAPLTAAGLAKPYVLSTGCSMSVPGQEVFVEGAIYDPFTNTVSVYNPLVIDQGTTAAINPIAPKLPDGAVVALWFGTNADILTLAGDVVGGNCVNGLPLAGKPQSLFGQFAYCNAPTFFANAINVEIPDLGVASDGQPCLTTRDFGLVDADQS